MSVRTAGRPLAAAASLPAVLNTVRAHGLRVSTARRLVLEALIATERPLTAEEIAGERSDLASVYRNLETLESIGVVRHVHLGHGPGRYALSSRNRGWATCETCGRSTPLAGAALAGIRAAVREAAGFDASFTHFPIVGRCPDCLVSPPEGARP
jgi:Fur family transcriptional regulator, ferric uptake regulator